MQTRQASALELKSVWSRLLGPRPDRLARAIVALGISQIIGWGTTVYALGVLGQPISADTGWSRAFVFGGLSVGLAASAAVSVPAGRWLDRAGGRPVMSVGSVLAAAGLAALAFVHSGLAYYAAWCVIGFAMRLALYDAAMAALVRLSATRGRRAISQLTLFGGFASTVMWPIGAALEAAYGWRATLLVYAALNLLCLPVHWLALAPAAEAGPPHGEAVTAVPPGVTTAPAPTAVSSTADATLSGPERRRALLHFTITMTACILVTSAIAVQMVSVLTGFGLGAATAVWFAMAQGAAQTSARIVDLKLVGRVHALTVARVTLALVLAAVLIAAAGIGGPIAAALFVLLFGAANGMVTIVRSAVPLVIFGAAGYGAMLGRIVTPMLAANAIAPVLLSVLIDWLGQTAAMRVLAALAAVAFASMLSLGGRYARR